MSAFVIHSGKLRGKRLRLSEPELVVGRDTSCRIRLSSEEVSRFHCMIRKTDAGWSIRDLGSSNGTYVNNAAIEGEYLLQPGDLLSIGPMTLQFTTETSTPRKRSGAAATSEDEIAGWLSDGPPSPPASIGDTTIITPQARKPRSEAAQRPPAEHESSHSGVPSLPQRHFDSVAEEAADIIRRHWESLKAEEGRSEARG